MRLVDTRPPFAGLANLSEGALASLPTPCYLLDEAQLRRNGEILLGVQQRTGCKILLAQKAFSNFDLYPLLAPCLAGTEASGLYESRLGKEELPEKENHVFCAAYRVDEFNELLDYADHIVFNSRPSWQSSALRPRRRARASVCASTRSAPRRKAMPSMTPAPRAAVSAPPAPSGTRLLQNSRASPPCWTACTSTPSVSRTPTLWP